MNSKCWTHTALAAVVLTLSITAQIAAQEQTQHTRYKIKDLGTFGGTFSQGASINNHGQISGSSTQAGDAVERAFSWHRGVMTDLGTLGGPNSSAIGDGSPNLNSRGMVAGFSDTSTPDPLGEAFFCGFGTGLTCLPFVWRNGTMTPLPLLGGNNGFANSINDRGIVTGLAENSVHDPTCAPPQVLQFKPVYWAGGKVHELAALPGDTTGEAEGINEHGDIVGATFPDCSTPSVVSHAVLWHRGKPHDLGTLGGTLAVGVAINSLGQVVGASNLTGDDTTHAFLWTSKDGIQDLGALGNDTLSEAIGNNDQGQAVGLSCDDQDNCRGFLWQRGRMEDLNELVAGQSPLYLFLAYHVNALGQIVGLGITQSGEGHAFVAIPCDSDQAGSDGCGIDGGAGSAVNEVTPAMKAAISQTVRRFFERRPGLRFHQPVRANHVSDAPDASSRTQSPNSVDYFRAGEPPLFGVRGLCNVDSRTNRLTGGCVGSQGLHCVGGASPSCPAGAKAIKPEYVQMCVYGRPYVDGARGCLTR